MAINFDDESRYLDMAKWFEKQTSYMDFEGFASGSKLLKKVDKAIENRLKWDSNKDRKNVIRTLLIHHAFEELDQGDYEMKIAEMEAIVEFLSSILSCRYFLKETVK